MGVVSDFYEGITGQTAAEASLESARIQREGVGEGIEERRRASAQGLGFLAPLAGVGREGIEQAGFLTDPQAQVEFLQSNPLFKLALENANRKTENMAAARGRLSAGDTLQQLSQNVLLSATPLIESQKRSIGDLINLESGIAGGRANIAIGEGADISDLITSGAAAEAAGVVGAGQARTQGAQNLLTTGILAGSLFSDQRLKSDIEFKYRTDSGFNVYSWTWNKTANALGLIGDSFGVIAQEILNIIPEAVIADDVGYYKVNYEMIGVNHGG